MADNKKRTGEQRDEKAISGPGAADFIAAEGGIDRPGASRTKGMGQTRDEGPLDDAGRLAPRLADDPAGHPAERTADERPSGSQTGTIGGGGADGARD